jgi:hypothetical protein
MKPKLNIFKNGGQPQIFLMEDDPKIFKMEDNRKAKPYFRIG